MIETGETIVERSAGEAELLLYDYYKHMTTLTLVTLGGILSISQTAGIQVPFARLLPSLALVALAGTIALYGMENIIKTRLSGRPLSRFARWTRLAASGSFGVGVGAFLGVFGEVIGR